VDRRRQDDVTDNQTPPVNPPEEPAATAETAPMVPTVHTPDQAGAADEAALAPEAATPDHTRRNLWLAGGAGAVAAGVVLGGVAAGAAVLDRHDEHDGPQRLASVGGPAFGQERGPGPGEEVLGGRMPGGPLGGPLGEFGRDGALHGEIVFQDASGDYVTMTIQQGEVTAVSDTSLSLDSADGFSATYALTDETRSMSPDADGMTGIAVGDTVNVVAMGTNGDRTAELVVEGDFGRGLVPGFGPNGPEAA
jgi:hypothetical protein